MQDARADALARSRPPPARAGAAADAGQQRRCVAGAADELAQCAVHRAARRRARPTGGDRPARRERPRRRRPRRPGARRRPSRDKLFRIRAPLASDVAPPQAHRSRRSAGRTTAWSCSTSAAAHQEVERAAALGGRWRTPSAPGRPRRARHRRGRRLRRGARRARSRGRPTPRRCSRDLEEALKGLAAHAAHRGQPLLGARSDAARRAAAAARSPGRRAARAAARPRPGDPRRGPRRQPGDRRPRRRARARRRRASSPTATPARWPPPATAPRSASSAPPTSRASVALSAWTRRARSCRARGSPRGSCVQDGIPHRSSPTAWPAAS